MKNTLRQNVMDLSIALRLVHRSAGVEELARETHLVEAEVQLRVERLIQQGLVADELAADGHPVYRAVLNQIDLAFDPTDDRVVNTAQITKGVDLLRRDLIALAAQGSAVGAHLRTMGLRMSEQRYQAWQERIRKLEAEFGGEEPDDGPFRFLTVSLYPSPE